ncbi:hypothetical protein SAMN05444673_4375 [Bacillus sp. OV166]|uniref:hypothetical protein n=1 Tax=Bacillus sp. OV166 TaxID=1882763 RepID=UPI000A2ACDE5|nr:hypothetical protein [Bacillus sp. OV166]SMQ81552.1 hypothetical protein SAMN05444673_4375 [Bacillus sp. OV166]
MVKKISTSCLLLLLFIPHGRTYAIDRVVLNSVPIDRADMRIYLLADKKSWMDYENFSVQVGEQGQDVLYHFPDWYHGKYDSALYFVDISSDKQKDVVVVLNNDRAGLGKPNKDIHILNQMNDLLFKEVPVEPVSETLNRLAKIDQKGNVVTILAGKKEHKINLSKYHFVNPRTPHFSVETMEYTIEKGTLIGIVGAYVDRNDAVVGGLLGHLKIKYRWGGKRYIAQSITFKQAVPEP